MKQLAARAAPSYVCDCRRPSALGNMIKSLQIQFCIPCDIPPASVPLYTKSPTIFTDSRAKLLNKQKKKLTPKQPPIRFYLTSKYECIPYVKQSTSMHPSDWLTP